MNVQEHPVQPVYLDEHGVWRFRRNAIVRYLLDAGSLNLNDLACMDFSDQDWEQFSQLIGYSLSGFADLSYVRRETYAKAVSQMEEASGARPTPVAAEDACASASEGHKNLRLAVINILGDWCAGESDQFLADRLNERFCIFPIRLTPVAPDGAEARDGEDDSSTEVLCGRTD